MANELASIIKLKDLPVQEKVSRVNKEVRDSIAVARGRQEGHIDLLARQVSGI